MTRRAIFIFVVGMIILVGVFGVSGQVTLKAGSCEAHYRHHYIKPYISDALSCMFQIPCGTPQNVMINNARVDIVQCLCENKDANEDAILQFYSEKDASTAKELGLDVSYICNNFRKTFPR